MKYEGVKREDRIKNCKVCNGNPKKVKFTIPGFTGERCENVSCFEVILYEKIKP